MLRFRAWVVAAALILLGLGGCGDCDLEIKTHSLPDTVGESYSKDLHSDCGGDTWFLASFDLPPGIGLESDGDLEGDPSRPGIYSFTIGLVDYDSGDTAYQGYTLTVHPQ